MNEYPGEVNFFLQRFQKRPYEYLDSFHVLSDRFIGAHSIMVSAHERALLRERDVKVCHCPFSNCGKGVPETPALLEEGFVREIISKVQTMRKEAGFEVTDHITVYEEGNDKIKEVMTKYTDEIKNDVLADDMCLDAEGGYSKEWDINGEKVRLGVEKKM